MTPLEYRNKHHRCRYCEYCYSKITGGWGPRTIWKCKAKEKTLAVEELWNGKGMLCQVFKAVDIIDEI